MLLYRNFLFLLGLLAAAACGFHPVYKAQQGSVSDTSSVLTAIEIEPMPGQLGQLLHTNLEDLFNPTALPTPKKYRLSISLKEVEVPVAIEKTGQITRYNIYFTANFTLKDLKTGVVIDKGVIKTVGSYDAVDSRYSTFVTKSHTETTTLKQLGEDFKLHFISLSY
jgi:LPS-assembly lipoprotein